jgi:ankyrin repeat protein
MMQDTSLLTEAEETRYEELQLMALDFARDGDAVQLGSMIDAGLPVHLSDGHGNTLLMLAAYHGHVETVRGLLDRGADPERCNDRGQTPLAGVAFKGYLDVAKVLVAGGARADAPCRGGQIPLQFAALFGHREMYDFLLSRSAPCGRVRFLGLPTRFLLSVTSRLRKIFA